MCLDITTVDNFDCPVQAWLLASCFAGVELYWKCASLTSCKLECHIWKQPTVIWLYVSIGVWEKNEHTAVQLRRRRGLVNIGERPFVRDTSPQKISFAVNPPPPYINHPPSSLQKKKNKQTHQVSSLRCLSGIVMRGVVSWRSLEGYS